MMKKTEIKKGDYIVLVSSYYDNDCWKASIPENFVYKARENSIMPTFYLEKDIKGNNNNGWTNSSDSKECKVKLRFATPEEIKKYDLENKPISVIKNENLFPFNLIK